MLIELLCLIFEGEGRELRPGGTVRQQPTKQLPVRQQVQRR